jgi:hypothetical protein
MNQPSGMLIHQQNSYVPRSWWYTGRREAMNQSTTVRNSLYKALMKIIKGLCQDIWYKIKTGTTNFLNGRQLHIPSLGGTSMTDVSAVGHLPHIRN